ncbi:hypothetical protein [Pseudobutyrivibrio sp.]|uniref:hypothetical protein n=1 Tax=Pseudobutyrivibrio sp. TaxID=2014367 RepID=UPI0025ED6CAC|nr:hypothetical protein [Pseudobutyrivibrio sp.]MBR5648696.1 hypothetical protein [Pseudobutyrivibrio sp.]
MGVTEGDIADRLPSTLVAIADVITESEGNPSSGTGPASSYEVDQTVSVPVTWECQDFDAGVPGEYTFTARCTDSAYRFESGVRYPDIRILLQATIDVPVEKEVPIEEPEEEVPSETPENEPVNNTPEQQVKPTPAPTPSEEQPAGGSSDNNSGNGGSNSSENNAGNGESNSSENNAGNGGSSSSGNSSGNSSSGSSSSSNTVAPATETPVAATPTDATPEAQTPTQQAASTNTSHSNSGSRHSDSPAPKVEEQVTEASIVVEETPIEEPKETPNDIPVSVTNKTETKSEMSVGKGKAVINIQNDNSSEVNATITDDETLLKNILTDEQLKRVAEGATVNLKISANIVKESDLTAEDADNIQKGVEEYKKDVPGLAIAGYLDISIYLQMDDEDWSYVSNTNKPVELVINVPDSMKGLSKNYYILRLHDGQTSLFSDNDDDPDTITISTGKFSIYVVMYDSEAAAEIEKSEKNEINLLIIFVIALIVVLVIQIVYIFAIRKKLHSSGQ